MADDKGRNQQGDSGERDDEDGFGTADSGDTDYGGSGLGNLPPLSDFESSAGGGFDSGLPPLSSIDSDSDRGGRGSGGLPPISDIPVETPQPTGGAIKPPPAEYGSTPVFGTPSSDSGLDTPSGTGFQDLSADSDFTPETPEVAPPGPESDIDTPLFDSAFGGSGSFSAAADTSAPTQAMETPMFGADRSDQGFDADAFGSGARRGGYDQGTPVPDFGPDTAAPTAMTPPPVAMGAPRGGGGGKGGLIGIAALVIGIIAGALAGPFVPGVPNPAKTTVAEQETTIADLRAKLAEFAGRGPGAAPLDEAQIVALRAEEAELQTSIEALTGQIATANSDLTTVSTELDAATAELERTNAEYVQARDDLERAENREAITEARRSGLEAEVARLENLNSSLEAANTRRMLTKETLESNIERLEILVQESPPLAPEKYSRDARIAAVANLKDRARGMNWVDPQLLDAYTALYLDELEIARSREYFFARLPVTDRFGTTKMSWAECVMNGNWGVYYRTLDGEHVGVYQNTAASGTPHFSFIDVRDETGRANLEAQIFASRTEGYEEKLELLAKRQLVYDDRTPLQRNFESL